MDLPLFAPIRQTAPQPVVTDIAGEVRRQWLGSRLAGKVRRGDRVAVGVGSRGIANLSVMVRATLDSIRDLGGQPFVVAAMGSHGGATPQGQRELLAEYGVSEQALGVAVKTDMTAVQIGTNSWGEPVWWDRNALEADAVVTISRVKPHTDFRGRIESGITKMLVIGLGKRDGAAQHHRWGFRGLRDMLPETARVILEKTPFVAGLAVLENAHEQTARLQAVDREDLLDVEPILLEEARGLMGRLPFDKLDLLVIGEIGKNYSGAGIDPNVVGRLLIETEPDFERPKITRICCLDLSPESHGNGTGVGIADLTTDRLLGRHRPGALPDEQPDRLLPVAFQAAVRIPHRPRLHPGRPRHLLAAQSRRPPPGHHPQHAGSDRPVGLRRPAGRGERTSAPGGEGGVAGAAVRREGEFAAKPALSPRCPGQEKPPGVSVNGGRRAGCYFFPARRVYSSVSSRFTCSRIGVTCSSSICCKMLREISLATCCWAVSGAAGGSGVFFSAFKCSLTITLASWPTDGFAPVACPI